MNDLLPGTEVSARGLRWELVESQNLGEQTLYRLRGIEGAVQGMEVDLLHPLEEIHPIASEIDPKKASPLSSWLIYHQAFILDQALGNNTILSVQPGRINIEPYQIVPLMRALKMSRPRLLLCDDVGLGKTIQAGLIITELMARRMCHRVLIVSPAGPLLRQWKKELLERFGLRVEGIDREKIEDIKKKSELGANPFDHVPLGIVSIDFLKQERLLEQLERSSYDIVVIDEAHHCADTGGSQEYEESLRRNLAKVLATRCDTLLLLTATPHNGIDRSFASLLELLDISLVDGKGAIRGEKYRPYVVRRLKKHIKDPITGADKFKDRIVIPVPVLAPKDRYQPYIDFQKGLLDFISPELKSAFRTKRYSDVLAFIALLKRSVSAVYSCVETLKVIRDRFNGYIAETTDNQTRRKERIRTIKDYNKKIEQFGAVSYEEEQDQQNIVAEDLADQLASIEREVRRGGRKLSWSKTITEGLDHLIVLGEKAISNDPKLEAVVEEIKKIRSDTPKANILVYTEYADSQATIANQLIAEKIGTVLALSGEDTEKDREKITGRFTTEHNIVLVSTDATAEGLNLQNRCHHLIHFELPFNPNRLEQRNGRIDRYGQEHNPVIRYLFLKNTFEDRILLRLIAKYEKQRSRLSFVPNTLGISCATEASCARLLKGVMDQDETLFKDDGAIFVFDDPEKDTLSDPGVKELLDEVDRSFKGFETAVKSNVWLGESGVNAETILISEASEARESGMKLSGVDLVAFVCNAAAMEGGVARKTGDVAEIALPSLWNYGLDDLPGYESANRLIRLTNNLEVNEDAKGNPVGYLGRSHPLVKRALDRVRNVAFGGRGQSLLDPRATAIQGADSTPNMLFTYLAAVSSRKGRVYEKVIAVRMGESGSSDVYLSPEQWAPYCDLDKAIKTTDVWEHHFAGWGGEASDKAIKKAEESFKPLGEKFIEGRHAELEQERARLKEWFDSRVKEITGTTAAPVQYGFFDIPEKDMTPHWAGLEEPMERLSAFATDKHNSRAKCSEAETLLRLYKVRSKDLDDSLGPKSIRVTPLGVMMIAPTGGTHGA